MSQKFEEYKKALDTHHQFINSLRKDVEKIIEQRGLHPLMNDTKWLELQEAVSHLPFPPAYIVKCLTDKDDSVAGILGQLPDYHGNWSAFYEEGLPPFFNIEWIQVSTVYGIHRGKLVSPEILDETTEFTGILERFSIPYEADESHFTIYGYQ